MDKKVYIVQVHENASDGADEISVFASLEEAAANYNETIAETEDLYGNEGYEKCLFSAEKVAAFEGKEINEEYEVANAGCIHTISLYSRTIKL